GRHARTRAITRDTVSPVNRLVGETRDASRDVARVVSGVSVLCPRLVVCFYNRERLWRSTRNSGGRVFRPPCHHGACFVDRAGARGRNKGRPDEMFPMV